MTAENISLISIYKCLNKWYYRPRISTKEITEHLGVMMKTVCKWLKANTIPLLSYG